MPTPPGLLRQLAETAADAGALLAPAGVTDALAATADAARAAFDAAACSIVVVDEPAGEIVWRASAGAGAQEATGMRLPITEGITGYVANAGTALVVDDVSRDPRFARAAAERTGYVPTTMLVVPLLGDERVLGALSILDRAPGRIATSEALDLAARFAAVAAALVPVESGLADLGTLLLRAAADAADDADLVAALRRAARTASGPDAELLAAVALLAELRRAGPAERDAAIAALEAVLGLSRARRRR
jgi:GAF domain-containing protein